MFYFPQHKKSHFFKYKNMHLPYNRHTYVLKVKVDTDCILQRQGGSKSYI